jgi:hypothetical protein
LAVDLLFLGVDRLPAPLLCCREPAARVPVERWLFARWLVR